MVTILCIYLFSNIMKLYHLCSTCDILIEKKIWFFIIWNWYFYSTITLLILLPCWHMMIWLMVHSTWESIWWKMQRHFFLLIKNWCIINCICILKVLCVCVCAIGKVSILENKLKNFYKFEYIYKKIEHIAINLL